jgi:hypothetical protein
MTLGLTQPLTEMSTRNHLEGKGRPVRKADLTAIYEPIVYKIWEHQHLTSVGASTACYRDNRTLHLSVEGKRGILLIWTEERGCEDEGWTHVTLYKKQWTACEHGNELSTFIQVGGIY